MTVTLFHGDEQGEEQSSVGQDYAWQNLEKYTYDHI